MNRLKNNTLDILSDMPRQCGDWILVKRRRGNGLRPVRRNFIFLSPELVLDYRGAVYPYKNNELGDPIDIEESILLQMAIQFFKSIASPGFSLYQLELFEEVAKMGETFKFNFFSIYDSDGEVRRGLPRFALNVVQLIYFSGWANGKMVLDSETEFNYLRQISDETTRSIIAKYKTLREMLFGTDLVAELLVLSLFS